MGAYGHLSIDSVGNWTYTRDADLDSLTSSASVVDTVTVLGADGISNQAITVTITGVNDIATITGERSGTMTEDVLTATGQATIADLEIGRAHV
mgnify:CR=1 FL=1